MCRKVVGERQKDLTKLYERRVIDKRSAIANYQIHVLNKKYELLLYGHRYVQCSANQTELDYHLFEI